MQRTFGYDGNTIVPKEAAAIRKACHALLNGATLWSIAKEWNAKGLKTSKGYLWEGSKVRQVLLRPSIAGLAVHDGEILDGVTARVEADHRPRHLGVGAQILSDPKRFTGRSMGRKHLLSGIAYCGECGKRMGTMSKPTKTGAKRVVYQCKNIGLHEDRARPDQTDELVVGVITERLADPEAARKLAKPTVDTKALHDQIDTLRKLITATRERIRRRPDRRPRPQRPHRPDHREAVPAGGQAAGRHMCRDVKDLAGKPDAADRFEALPLDRRRGVIDTLATVTIHRQTKAGWQVRPRGDHRRLAVITLDDSAHYGVTYSEARPGVGHNHEQQQLARIVAQAARIRRTARSPRRRTPSSTATHGVVESRFVFSAFRFREKAVANPNVITRDTVLPDRLLDVDEVADFLDCCPATVRREANRGRLRGMKVGSRWRFQPDDVAAYLDGETPASTAERTAWDAYIRKVVAEAPPLTTRADRRAVGAVRLGARRRRCAVSPPETERAAPAFPPRRHLTQSPPQKELSQC